jgi:hypothetical protein
MRFIEENLFDQWRFQTDFKRKSALDAGDSVVGESAAVVLGVGVVVVVVSVCQCFYVVSRWWIVGDRIACWLNSAKASLMKPETIVDDDGKDKQQQKFNRTK